MNAWIFQAALWCDSCAGKGMAERDKPAHVNMSDEYSYDSDEWPKGPYSDGGGESDYPQHCDGCGTFLENPLTPDGYAYVKDAMTRPGPGVAEWAEFYRMGA